MQDLESWTSEDTIRVLVASDIHLGYLENDAIRGEDSFSAFEEVLSHAVQYDVDFILLGGDLFDHAKPSPNSMFKCTQIIRKYCFGDKPVSIEMLSNQLENFSRSVNYEDPNLNVSYPILSIHGNHDDPVGQGSVSSLDILSITGLVNYFGKWSDYTNVRISPVLMQKGATKLALYGLSHLKDQRLARLFAEKKVEMELPDNSNEWFNLLVLHQNRQDRGPNNYIQEKVLPHFLDLVVWGHEHDSQVFPIRRKKADNDGFFVVQPGSTVATSLAAGEALPKHCALLQIHKKEFILTPIPLKSVRPFIFKTLVLSEERLASEGIKESDKVQEFLIQKVNEAIEEAKSLRNEEDTKSVLPLVRLSVFYERETQNFNKIRFGQNFNGLVANPNDILLMKKEKRIKEKRDESDLGGEEDQEVKMANAAATASDVETMIKNFYQNQPPERRLKVLSVRAMTEAVRDFTLKRDEDIFRKALEAHKKRCVEMLMESEDNGGEDIEVRIRHCKEDLDAADADRLKVMLDGALKNRTAAKRVVVNESSDDEPVIVDVVPASARGGGRSRTTRGSRGRGNTAIRSRGAANRTRGSPEPMQVSPVPERRTPRRSAAQKSNTWVHSLAASRKRNDSDLDDSD